MLPRGQIPLLPLCMWEQLHTVLPAEPSSLHQFSGSQTCANAQKLGLSETIPLAVSLLHSLTTLLGKQSNGCSQQMT